MPTDHIRGASIYDNLHTGGGPEKLDEERVLSYGGCVKLQTGEGGGVVKNLENFADVINGRPVIISSPPSYS